MDHKEAKAMGANAALDYMAKLKAKELLCMITRHKAPCVPPRSLAGLRGAFGARADNPRSQPRRAFDWGWRRAFLLLSSHLETETAAEGNAKVAAVVVAEARRCIPRFCKEHGALAELGAM